MKTFQKSLTLLLISLVTVVSADTSLTAFSSRWDTDNAGEGDGYGGRFKTTFLAVGAVEARGSVIEMDDEDTTLYPFDFSLNVRIPFIISPYAGVGVGYTLVDSSSRNRDDMTTLHAHVGLEATFIWFGVMAEVRVQDAEDDDFDGTNYNLGVLFTW